MTFGVWKLERDSWIIIDAAKLEIQKNLSGRRYPVVIDDI